MEDLENHLRKSFEKKTADHHLQVYARVKQFIDSVLATSSSQNTEERSKTLFTGLQTIRDLLISESNDAMLHAVVANVIEAFHSKEEAHERDLEVLESQDLNEKKSLSQESE